MKKNLPFLFAFGLAGAVHAAYGGSWGSSSIAVSTYATSVPAAGITPGTLGTGVLISSVPVLNGGQLTNLTGANITGTVPSASTASYANQASSSTYSVTSSSTGYATTSGTSAATLSVPLILTVSNVRSTGTAAGIMFGGQAANIGSVTVDALGNVAIKGGEGGYTTTPWERSCVTLQPTGQVGVVGIFGRTPITSTQPAALIDVAENNTDIMMRTPRTQAGAWNPNGGNFLFGSGGGVLFDLDQGNIGGEGNGYWDTDTGAPFNYDAKVFKVRVGKYWTALDIGNSAPSSTGTVHIAGNPINLDGSILISSGAGTGKIWTSDSSGYGSWQDAGGGSWTVNGNSVYRTSGYVGVDMSSGAAYALDVNGQLRAGPGGIIGTSGSVAGGDDTVSINRNMSFGSGTGAQQCGIAGVSGYFFIFAGTNEPAMIIAAQGIASEPTIDVYGDSTTFHGGVWAGAYHDLTPYPLKLQEAYDAVLSMKSDGKGGLDHKALHKSIRYERDIEDRTIAQSTGVVKGILGFLGKKQTPKTVHEYSRNLSATVSAQNAVIQDLVATISEMKKRIDALEKK